MLSGLYLAAGLCLQANDTGGSMVLLCSILLLDLPAEEVVTALSVPSILLLTFACQSRWCNGQAAALRRLKVEIGSCRFVLSMCRLPGCYLESP